MTRLYIDTETYSPEALRNGVYRYAEQAEILLLSYAIDDGPVAVVDVVNEGSWPSELQLALHDPGVEVWAHNAQFDRVVMRAALPALRPPLTRWRCSMAAALAHSLPPGLAELCAVLKLPYELRKLDEGKGLIRRFCIPSALRERATRESHPDEWARFVAYAGRDIVAMRECLRRMPTCNYRGDEVALWHLDQTINDRGFGVDLRLAQAAVDAVARERKALAAATHDATDGAVGSATQRDALLGYLLAEHGVALPDMRADTLERRLADEALPKALRELLRLRLAASTSSVSKFATVLRVASRDGRIRGGLQFAGAMRTARWSGRLFQPQNLKRPDMAQHEIDSAIEALHADALELTGYDVMRAVSNTVRGVIVPARGNKLVVADLANIEGRAQAWLAGEAWKLAAFRDYDTCLGADGNWYTAEQQREAALAGDPARLEADAKGEPVRKGPDLYRLAFSQSFGVPLDAVTKTDRQIGKVEELSMGYQGGVNAFATFAAVYGIDLPSLTGKVLSTAPSYVIEEARDFLDWQKSKSIKSALADDVFAACDVVKRLWRAAHPRIAEIWKELQRGAALAIDNPGQVFCAGGLVMKAENGWFRIRLPSGRYLCYPGPSMQSDGTLMYYGVNQYTRKWSQIKTYGGKLFENVCQAVARDVMAANMSAIDKRMPIVLTVHDEIVTEPSNTPKLSSDLLAAMLSTPPAWASDLPLSAAGFEANRYRKD